MVLIQRLVNANGVISALPQVVTNGNSTYGTFDQKLLPPFLPGNYANLPCGKPWGCRTVEGTNSYDDFPITGIHRPYDFTITRQYLSPDGVNRSVILVNGQFLGPMIEANWGDTIDVKVHNGIGALGDLEDEGTALHWHGLNQKPTPWFDGVPSVQQCPIVPQKDFEYSFVATNYGSSWWHSHYSAQYAAGILGPMIIYGPVQNSVQYDEDLGPILLSDWYHPEYFSIIQGVMSNITKLVPRSDNNLIQGKAAFLCPDTSGTGPGANGIVVNGTLIGTTPSLPSGPGPGPAVCAPNPGLATFKIKKGKRYRLRLINTSAEGTQRFSIDSHNLTVFANDFVPIQPYSTEVVTLGVGQRSDVVLEANADGDTFWIRSTISSLLSGSIQELAKAALYYEGANYTAAPNSTAFAYNDAASVGNDDLTLTEPVFALPIKEPDLTLNITIGLGANATGHELWWMNNSSFRADYNDPLLLEAKLNHTAFPTHPEWNVYNTGAARTVRLIIDANVTVSHPLHLHGHDFAVLAQGNGTWDGTIACPANPQRRDVQLFPLLGQSDSPSRPRNRPYLVLQFEQDNPGVWPFHCHIAWHVSAGLYVNILERAADIATETKIPGILAQTCRDWAIYTNTTVVDEIDSGL